jgi:hypothetical protein
MNVAFRHRLMKENRRERDRGREKKEKRGEERQK